MKDAREQMRANLEAVLFEHYGLPRLYPLSRKHDRVLWRGTPEFIKAMEGLVRRGSFAVWDAVGNHGPSALRGWREDVTWWSVQVVLHGIPGIDDLEIEGDVDRVNPNRGLCPLILHGADILRSKLFGGPGPFRIAQALQKRGIAIRVA